MLHADIALQRLANQHLIGIPLTTPAEVMSHLGAVQAQDYTGAKWAIAQRLKTTSNSELDAAFNNGIILRTHVLRPTWHFVLPKDIRWMLQLTGPRVSQIMNSYNKKLELDRDVFNKTNLILVKVLQGKHFSTRAELAEVLAENGIAASGQRLGHIVAQAELDGIICSGPLRGKQFTYGLIDELAPKPMPFDRDAALAEITRRYYVSHGPALIADCAWWSGLTMADVRHGLDLNDRKLVSTEINGKTYWHAPTMAKVPKLDVVVHLLPNYDESLISYKDYSPIFSERVQKLNHQFGNALVAHLIVLNGQIIGGWRRKILPKELRIKLEPLTKLSAKEMALITTAAKQYGTFLNLPVSIVKSL